MALNCISPSVQIGNSCVCQPGFFYASNGTCVGFQPENDGKPVSETSAFGFQPKFDISISQNDGSFGQKFFFILTLATLGVWIGGTLFLRLMPMRGIWFHLRRFVSMVDYAFSKKHWIDEQKVQVKRKTELGGMLSIGAFIFIIGICLGIFYQFVNNKTKATQNIVPTNGRDVQEFYNDFIFNVTTVSNMKCSQWINYENITVGGASFNQRTFPVTDIATLTCYDTDIGPLVSLICSACQIAFDDYFSTWQFVDRPEEGLYAAAVGFKFSVMAASNKTGNGKIRKSFVSGQLQAGSNGTQSKPSTLRDAATNGSNINEFRGSSIINFRFIPRVFEEDNNLKLIQTTFHEFQTGNYFTNATNLQESIATGTGSLSVTMHTEVLSAYIVETTVGPSIGILTFLSKIGGIYQLGILLFFFTLNMSERWVIFLRYDDKLLNRLERQRLARAHWRKVRVAVKMGLVTGRFMANATEGKSESVSQSKPKSPFARVRDSLMRLMSLTAKRLQRLVSLTMRPQQAGQEDMRGTSKSGNDIARTESSVGLVSESPSNRTKTVEHGDSLVNVPPDLPSNDIKIKVDDVDESVSSSKKGNSIPRFFGKDVASEIRTTGQVTGRISSSVKFVSQPSAPSGESSELKSNPDANAAEKTKKKLKKKPRDTRLGSTSEHKGSVVRSFRNPSWIQGYEMLPAVPYVEEVMQLGQKVAEQEEKRKRKVEELGEVPPEKDSDKEEDSDDGVVQLDPVDLYNYLIELYDYQARLRNDFLAAQSMLENVVQRFRPHSDL